MSTAELKVFYSQMMQGDMSFMQEHAVRCLSGSSGGSDPDIPDGVDDGGSVIDQMVDMADTDGNGILEESEYLASGQLSAGEWEMFVCAGDQNGDGQLSTDEAKVISNRMQASLQAGDQNLVQEIAARCAVA